MNYAEFFLRLFDYERRQFWALLALVLVLVGQWEVVLVIAIIGVIGYCAADDENDENDDKNKNVKEDMEK